MIDLGAYCIDRTEVTIADYSAFFLATGGDGGVLPAGCTNPVTTAPAIKPGSFPRGDVSWCAAWAYCKWAGKRLCGKVGGGTLTRGTSGDSILAEWYRACSNGGFTKYPYGDNYVPGRCNDNASDAGGFAPVGSFPACATEAGVLDLVGNINEWVDACDDPAASPSQCTIIGGAAGFAKPDCTPDQSQPRDYTTSDVGFRCCATP